jgi:zinc transporter ZupT
VDTYIQNIKTEIVNPLILLLMAGAAAYFIWGVFLYVKNSSDDSDKGEGKRHMIYGVIGLAIMMSVFKIIDVITATVGKV